MKFQTSKEGISWQVNFQTTSQLNIYDNLIPFPDNPKDSQHAAPRFPAFSFQNLLQLQEHLSHTAKQMLAAGRSNGTLYGLGVSRQIYQSRVL